MCRLWGTRPSRHQNCSSPPRPDHENVPPILSIGLGWDGDDGGDMRRVWWTLALCALALLAALGAPAAAAPTRTADLGSADAVLRWINGYRLKPDLARVPQAVRTLSRLDALRDPETSAAHGGVVAVVIGSHPHQ